MAYEKIAPYTRGFPSIIAGGEKQRLEDELKKLEDTIRVLIAAIEQLQAKVP